MPPASAKNEKQYLYQVKPQKAVTAVSKPWPRTTNPMVGFCRHHTKKRLLYVLGKPPPLITTNITTRSSSIAVEKRTRPMCRVSLFHRSYDGSIETRQCQRGWIVVRWVLSYGMGNTTYDKLFCRNILHFSYNLRELWCRRRDSNPHTLASTWT